MDNQFSTPLSNEQTTRATYAGYDTVFAWCSLLFGYLLARTLPVSLHALGGMLMTCALFVCGGIYLRLSGVRLQRRSVLFASLMMVFSVGFLTGSNRGIHLLLLLFLLCAFLYWIYTSFDLNPHGVFGKNFFVHVIAAVFSVPKRSLKHVFCAMLICDRKGVGGKVSKTILWILLGLCCAALPTILIILLLSYDPQFTSLLEQIFSFRSLSDNWIELVVDIGLGVLFAMILFGVLYACKQKSREEGEDVSDGAEKLHRLPRALLCATVTPILAVYVIFFISQWEYYVSAFTGKLPETMTYAKYARNGFFQLCWVCAINAVMLLVFNLLIRRSEQKKDILRSVYTGLISVFTMVLIATALSKMLLYIDSFGLTRKRVYASWLILMLAVFFATVLIWQFVRRIPLCTVLAVTFVVFFAAIVLPNVDAMIAQYNVNAYLSGELETVDVWLLSDCGVSAVPALNDLKTSLESRESPSEEEQTCLKTTVAVLADIKADLEKDDAGVWGWSFPKIRAKRLLEDMELPIDADKEIAE